MKNLASKLVIVVSLLSMVACKPSMQPPPHKEEGYIQDTLENVQTFSVEEDTSEDLTIAPITIRVYDEQIQVESGNVNTVYTVDASSIYIKRSETGLVSYLKVNNTVLFEENTKSATSHSYVYITDNIIKIQKGNTIDGIIADHKDLKLSRKKLLSCNQFLNRGLQVGDLVKLNCQCR